MRRFGVAVLAAMALASSAEAQITVVSEQPYAVEGAQRFVLTSRTLGRDFIVVVTPPAVPIVPGMPGPRLDQRLPAVYALDGGYGVAGPLAQVMTMSGVTAPAYGVSIDYPPGAGQRSTDFLFAPVTEGGSTYGGGGPAFLTFLTDELLPFLEARYPIDPERAVLFGHSFGGLFAANVLAEAPDSFSGYIIASASTWRDPSLTERLAGAAPRAGARRVFVGVGEREDERMRAAAQEIADALGAAGSTVKVESHVFEGENHVSYYPKLTQAGLAWTIPSNAGGRTPTGIGSEAMDRVAGVYLLPDGRHATIKRSGGGLAAELPGAPGDTALLAETSTRFFPPGGDDILLEFEGPSSGPANVLVLTTGGGVIRAVRAVP
jgi:pimeloyl-ACP methyl ester carboxylesterase